MLKINYRTYEKLVLVSNQVPQLVDLYEQRNGIFTESVKLWLKNVEKIFKEAKSTKASEFSTLRLMILSGERGVIKNDSSSGHISKRKFVDGLGIQALTQSQNNLQPILSRSEEEFSQYKQLIRKMFAVASDSEFIDKIPKHFTTFDISFFWKNFLSDPITSSWASRILESASYSDTIILVNEVLDELRKEQKQMMMKK
ncbi:hypothetical protein [Nitrosopumilus ureiphilus]|uniref:Uncharacterized protein n=1 Tax=Nitrosopumilus ureiphilus TaxID=1470067 RepID=A0A7D5M7L9_9ARCH|nr:hypothetical protein [Nitrosopumilus ureiphilus]QLH06428.1 hypothetical protein C5F50_04565 [Nitrosopumilus ureiphilus]